MNDENVSPVIFSGDVKKKLHFDSDTSDKDLLPGLNELPVWKAEERQSLDSSTLSNLRVESLPIVPSLKDLIL